MTIQDHQVIPYETANSGDTRDALQVLDQSPADASKILLIYSGWLEWATNWSTSTNADGWNREHLWPESLGTDGTNRQPAHTDLFKRPCNSRVNSSRGKKYFDWSNPADNNYAPQAHTSAPACSADTDSWEPPDSMKGDIARALFYMDVRYEGDRPSEPDLVLLDPSGPLQTNTLGRLTALLHWHQFDPV